MNIVVINTDELTVYGVFDDEAKAIKSVDKMEFNSLIADEEDHLRSLSAPELAKVYNSLEGHPVNKFENKSAALTRAWNRLSKLDLMKPKRQKATAKVADLRRNAPDNKKIVMLDHDVEGKIWRKKSIRKTCYDILVQLTGMGTKETTVSHYLTKCGDAEIPRARAMMCLYKLCDDRWQEHQTFEMKD